MRKCYVCLFIMLSLAVLTQVVAAQEAPSTAKPEITSLLGVQYYAQADEKGEIAAAQAKLAADPKNIELFIALGRAQAAAWQYQAAIATYTRVLKLAPDNAMLYRHRGHRFISTRRFDNALVDLAKAAKLKADDYDIWYHLGLAFYLKGQFERAAQAYEKCKAVAEASGKDDSVIAISDWLYMTYRRLGKRAEAAKVLDRITPQMKVDENKSYFDRLLFYKGLKKEEELINIEKATDLEIATVGYGLGNWHLYNGDKAKAEMYFQRVVKGKYWPAFGFIAAEAELARSKK